MIGVMLFELCAGHTLFRQDIANDMLVGPGRERPGGSGGSPEPPGLL
jgi:hypothetical protein